MTLTPSKQFLHDAGIKSADLVHRDIIRLGMDNYEASFSKGKPRFLNWEAARSKAQQIRREAINHLDHYLLQFEAQVKARGGHVFFQLVHAERAGPLAFGRGDCRANILGQPLGLLQALPQGGDLFQQNLGVTHLGSPVLPSPAKLPAWKTIWEVFS